MRGRKPKPTKLKVIEGNPGKRKIKEDPDMSSGLPSPPSHLDEYARQEWERLASGLHAIGILYEVDTAVFAAYCQAFSRWRVAEEGIKKAAGIEGATFGALVCQTAGGLRKHPLVDISEKAAAAMVKYSLEFGLTPSARARLAIDPAKGKGGKFNGLVGRDGKRG
jgi:P27 family predicted phage terminase small subunit